MDDVITAPVVSRDATSHNATAHDDVVCVDENDRCIGFMGKQAAHEDGGVLHRAFSIFIFNADYELLVQQRAHQKYHFSGRWSNTCCSHPRWNETVEAAAHRRLQEELGFDTSLQEIFSFVYQASDKESGLSEWEFDHVLVGRFDGEPEINEAEIAAWKWMNLSNLRADINDHPNYYTAWFIIALDRVMDYIQHNHVSGQWT